jgi:hypothetical protein
MKELQGFGITTAVKKKSLFNWFLVFPVFNTKKPTRTAQN